MKIHHLVGDGWTIKLLADDIHSTFTEFRQDETMKKRNAPAYLDYLGEERAYLDSPEATTDAEFWFDLLDPVPEPLPLVTTSRGLRSKRNLTV